MDIAVKSPMTEFAHLQPVNGIIECVGWWERREVETFQEMMKWSIIDVSKSWKKQTHIMKALILWTARSNYEQKLQIHKFHSFSDYLEQDYDHKNLKAQIRQGSQ